MQFYKEQGIDADPRLPADVPADADLDRAVQRAAEHVRAAAGAVPLGLHWIKDLAKPDQLITLPAADSDLAVPGASTGSTCCRSCWRSCSSSSRSTRPSPPATTPEQEQQQKMMQWMTLLFPLMLYSGPSGLNLYILTSTAIGIIESKMHPRAHQGARGGREGRAAVIVDAPPTRGSRRKDRGDDSGGGGATRRPRRRTSRHRAAGSAESWRSSQDKAEAIKREAERKGR